MKVFKTLAHWWAWVLDTLIPKAESVAQDVEAIVGSQAAQDLLVLAGKGAWQPKINSVVGAIVSSIIQAAKDGKDIDAAIAAVGLNPILDIQAMNDLKAIVEAVVKVFGGKKVTVPIGHVVSLPQ